MKLQKILFATDFSDQAEVASRLATSLARDSGAQMIIAHTVEPAPVSADRGFGGYVAEDEATEAAQRQLDETAPSDAQVACAHKLSHYSKRRSYPCTPLSV